jgi:hypothetical protein
MKRRLYFILPDSPLARTVHNELLLARIPENHMHAIADERVELEDLPQASLWQRSDLAHGLQLGLPVGGLTGVVVGILAVLSGWVSPGFEAKTIMATVLAGVVVGTWAASMIAVNVPNSRHRAFEADLRQGHILFIVDVPVQRLEEISELVTRHHPEADMRGIEPNIPVFP